MQSFDVGTADSTSALACCRLGQGLTLSSLEPASSAVRVSRPTARAAPSGRDAVRYTLQAVDRATLRAESTSLRGSFSASLAVVSGTVEGGARWADSSARQYSYMRASVTVVTRVESVNLQNVALLPGLDLDDRRFEDLYGDGFVAAVTYGGQLEALVSVNKTETDKIRDYDFRGEVDAGIASASGSFERKLREATSGREVNINISQRGGSFRETALSPDMEALIASVKRFPTQVRAESDSAVPISFDAIRYKNLETVLRNGTETSAKRLFITKETLLIEQLSSIVQQYEIARRLVAKDLELDLVRTDPDKAKRLVEAYRRVQDAKARAMNQLVLGTLAPSTLDDDKIKTFPLALTLLKGDGTSGE